jgi:hypothetical protein
LTWSGRVRCSSIAPAPPSRPAGCATCAKRPLAVEIRHSTDFERRDTCNAAQIIRATYISCGGRLPPQPRRGVDVYSRALPPFDTCQLQPPNSVPDVKCKQSASRQLSVSVASPRVGPRTFTRPRPTRIITCEHSRRLPCLLSSVRSQQQPQTPSRAAPGASASHSRPRSARHPQSPEDPTPATGRLLLYDLQCPASRALPYMSQNIRAGVPPQDLRSLLTPHFQVTLPGSPARPGSPRTSTGITKHTRCRTVPGEDRPKTSTEAAGTRAPRRSSHLQSERGCQRRAFMTHCTTHHHFVLSPPPASRVKYEMKDGRSSPCGFVSSQTRRKGSRQTSKIVWVCEKQREYGKYGKSQVMIPNR